MSSDLLVERADGRGTITFNQPERRNAVTFAMWKGLPEALADLGADPDVRVIVLRGAGDEAFIAGANISEFKEHRSNSETSVAYNESTQRAFDALRSCDKPTVAMVRGFAFGGGCAIALGCDLRLAADDARFRIPAVRLGIGYGRENVEHLVRTLGPALTREMLLTAKIYDATEALRTGLVHQVVPAAELEDFTYRYTGAIIENAPLSMRAVKLAITAALKRDESSVAAADAAMTDCFDSADYQEGYNAFLEKRTPRFQGR